MSLTQIDVICNYFNITVSELIWGTEREKEEFAKMIVLALLLNDKANAFSNLHLSEWIEKEWNYDHFQREHIQADMKDAEKKYGFFANPGNYAMYERLQPDFDKDYERISNLILKQLLKDYDFSRKFYSHLTSWSYLLTDAPGAVESVLKDFILSKGSYALLILDKNGIDYPKFILAFNKFWGRVRDDYMQFFNKKLFVGDEVLLGKGMKGIQNQHFHNVLTSPEFIELNERLLLLDEYTDDEAIMSSLNMRLTMITEIQREKMFGCDVDEDLLRSYTYIQDLLSLQAKERFLENDI